MYADTLHTADAQLPRPLKELRRFEFSPPRSKPRRSGYYLVAGETLSLTNRKDEHLFSPLREWRCRAYDASN